MATRIEPMDSLLRRAEGLVAAANALAFALESLGPVELPPATGPDIDQAQLRAIAALYLANELEHAGVIPAAEGLAKLALSGSLAVNVGDAAPLVREFWRDRNARPSLEERQAFLAGLFGAAAVPEDTGRARNADFEDRFIDLCEALYKLDEGATNTSWGGVAQQARVRRASQRLLENLLRVSSSMTVMMAQEILGLMRQALAILAHAAVKNALRARSAWEVIDAVDRQLRQPLHEHDLYVRRGQAGMTILAWLAEAGPLLATPGSALVGLDHPVIPAAVDWLEATLSLGQAGAAPAAQPAPSSNWAALVG